MNEELLSDECNHKACTVSVISKRVVRNVLCASQLLVASARIFICVPSETVQIQSPSANITDTATVIATLLALGVNKHKDFSTFIHL